MKKLRILLLLLVPLTTLALLYNSTCSAEFIRIASYSLNANYYIDSDSVVCDIYNPPFYQIHGDVYGINKKNEESDHAPIYMHTEVCFYNYETGRMYSCQMITNYYSCISKYPYYNARIDEVTCDQYNRLASPGLEMFRIAFNTKFPYRYANKK